MANELVQIVLRAKDEATRQIRVVSGELGGLTRTFGRLSGVFGVGGLGVGAVVTAGAALVSLANNYAQVVTEQEKLGLTMGKSRAEFEAARKDVANYSLEIERAGRQWKTFTENVGRASVGPGTAIARISGHVLEDLNTGRVQDLAVLLSQGAVMYERLKATQEDQRAEADKAARALEDAAKKARDAAAAAAAAEEQRKKQAAERIRKLQEIERLLGVGRTKAIEYQQALDRITSLRATQKLAQQVFEATGANPLEPTGAMAALAELGVQLPTPFQRRLPVVDQPVGFDFEKRNAAIKEWLATMPKLQSDIIAVSLEMQRANEEALSSLEITRGAYQAFEGGIHSGFTIIASNLRSEFQTINSAWHTMLDQMQAYYAEFLAQLAAKKVIQFLLGLIPGGGPGLSAGAGFIAGPGGSGPRLPPARDVAGRDAHPAGNIININLLDTRTLVGELKPGGALHRAQDQVRIGTNY